MPVLDLAVAESVIRRPARRQRALAGGHREVRALS